MSCPAFTSVFYVSLMCIRQGKPCFYLYLRRKAKMVCILRVFVCKPQGFIGESWEIIRYIYVCYFVFGG